MRMNPVVKRISVFPVSNGQYLICYDSMYTFCAMHIIIKTNLVCLEFAFYIDKTGRRSQHRFKIEWEGHPTAFAYHYPYVIAFEQQFIEIRSVIDVRQKSASIYLQ
jgi:hypothetical protein